ncbi:MFS transporter [soil metagenome]
MTVTPGGAVAPRAWVILGALVAATILSYVDRTILSLLVTPIRADLKINDLQMGLLMGPTFAVFFALMGAPLGWAADRVDRLRLAAVGVALWSLATALSGLSHEYWQLLLARVGVAVGEAVLLPTATSLVADSFTAQVRTRRVGVLGMAIYWGSSAALLVGGLLIATVTRLVDVEGFVAGFRPWQLVLITVAAPGLLVSAVLAILPEPKRTVQSKASAIPSFVRSSIASSLLERALLYIAFGLMAVVGYSVTAWAPTHLIRAFGWSAAQAGVGLGTGLILAATLAIWAATTIADRLAARGRHDAKYLVALGCTLIALPFGIALTWLTQPIAFILAACVAMAAAAACIAMGPLAAAELSSAHARGRAVGVYQMCVGLIGAGIGPPAVAAAAHFGTKAAGLGLGLTIVTSTGFAVAALIFWSRHMAFGRAARDVQVVEKKASQFT